MTPKERDNRLKSVRRFLTKTMDAKGHLSAWSATGLDFESVSGKLVRVQFQWQAVPHSEDVLLATINETMVPHNIPLELAIERAIKEEPCR